MGFTKQKLVKRLKALNELQTIVNNAVNRIMLDEFYEFVERYQRLYCSLEHG